MRTLFGFGQISHPHSFEIKKKTILGTDKDNFECFSTTCIVFFKNN